MKKTFKRVISIILTVAMSLTFCVPMQAKGSISDKSLSDIYLQTISEIPVELREANFEYDAILTEMTTRMSAGEDAITVYESLSPEEIETLGNVQKSLYSQEEQLVQDTSSWTDMLGMDSMEIDQMEQIDILANKYYEYYQTAGEFPTMSANTLADINLDTYRITEDTAIQYDMMYASTVDVSMLKSFGYTYTANQVSSHLAAIGIAITLPLALSFIELMIGLLGLGIITNVCYNVVNNEAAFSSSMLKYYAKSRTEVLTTIAVSQKIVRDQNNGVKFWAVSLADILDVGGLTYIGPVTETEARQIMAKNSRSENIYTLYSMNANALCLSITRIPPTAHSAHIKGHEKPLNFPHWHVTYSGGIQGHSHAFFQP